MSFSLASGVITQTGTDTDLSGLTGIAGVTTTVFNFTTEYSLYDITLKIDGTCTQADFEHLILTGPNPGNPTDKRSMTISSGGTFIFGEAAVFTDLNSVERTVYSGGQFLYFAKPTGPSSWNETEAGLIVESGGAMEIYGGYIRQNQAISFKAGSSLKMRNGRVAASSDVGFMNFYLRDATVDVIGFEYFCVEDTSNAALGVLANYDTFEGYEPSNIAIPIGPIDSIPHGLVIVEKYAGGYKNPIDINFRNSTNDLDEYRMMEATIGNNLIVRGRGITDSRGWATHYIRWTPTFVNSTTKAALVDIQVYMQDTDSTDRLSPYSPATQVIDLVTLADGQFSATTLDVLTGVWHNDSNTSIAQFVFDDRLPIYGAAIGYLYNISVLSLSDSTVGEDTANVQMVADVNVTQATKATVDAYTTIDNNAELYDRAKAELYDDFTGENALIVGIDGIYVVPTGGIVIDPAAAAAYAFTTLVTIKTSAYIGAIKPPTSTTVLQKGTSGEIDYAVNGDLQIEDASVDWTISEDVTDVENLDAGNNLTIYVINGASVGTSEAGTGNGQVNIIVAVPLKVIVKDIESSALIQDARVHIRSSAGGDLPYQDTVTITRVTTTATVAHTAHGMKTGETIYIKNAVQQEYNGEQVITVTTVNAYTYTVAGSPTTPATGTILASASLVNELTDALGEVNKVIRFTNDQPIVGTVRKATPP